MMDGYKALGEVRVSSKAKRVAEEQGRGERGGSLQGEGPGLPRLCQVRGRVP